MVLAYTNGVSCSPRHFRGVRLSTVATMKIVSHAIHGVEYGRKHSATGAPTEIMGFCIGHIDTADETKFVVSDVFPLPVEGSETAVVAESPEVMNYQSELVDSLEQTRKDRLIGWYHSHPFEVKETSNCFFSMVDVQTQRMFQTATDRNDFSWVGLVVDPLRTLALGTPDIFAFRAYPDSYKPPNNEAPDGIVWKDEKARTERWGPAYLSYYCLGIEYFQSSASAKLLNILSRDYLWVRTVSGGGGPLEESSKEDITARVSSIASAVNSASNHRITSADFHNLMHAAGELGFPSFNGQLEKAAVLADGLHQEVYFGSLKKEIKRPLFEGKPFEGPNLYRDEQTTAEMDTSA